MDLAALLALALQGERARWGGAKDGNALIASCGSGRPARDWWWCPDAHPTHPPFGEREARLGALLTCVHAWGWALRGPVQGVPA